MARKKKVKTQEPNYFEEVALRVAQLNELAAPFLENRPNKSLQDLYHDNTRLGLRLFKKAKEDWNAVHEVVALIADGHTPYGNTSRNGSLHHMLALSLPSLEAHAWRLNDFLRGKVDSPDLPFEIVARV